MHPPDEMKNPLPVDSLAAETERGSDSFSNLGKRIGRYAVAHERALAMRDHIAAQVSHQGYQLPRHQRIAHDLHNCGSYLVFRHYTEQERVRLHGLHSCKHHLICPFCAIRRGAKMLARYLERVQLVLAENPNLEAHMVTLTIKNGPDLSERFQHLHRSVKRYHKLRHLDRGHEITKARGAVWSYEFKRGSGSGLWHPHVHGVWLTEKGNAPDTAKLCVEWHAITGDSFIVETHPLYGELVDAFAEVFKYAVKYGDPPVADNLDAHEVLRGRRLIGCSGLLWGVEVPDDLADDLINDDPVFEDLFFRFVRGIGYVSTDGEVMRAA